MSDGVQDVHLVVRIPLVSRVQGSSINTVEAHNEVAKKLGTVTVAKFGKPGALDLVEKLTQQMGRTSLILVAKRDSHFLGFQSRLSSVVRGKPTAKMMSTAPTYYANIREVAGLWFTVTGPFTDCDLAVFRLSSNQRPLLDVLRECRTPSMLVERIR
jgi:hypothetical protein